MNESQKARLLEIAAKSAIRKHDWTDRGIAPLGYYQGMVLVFGRMYCKLQAGEAVALEAAKADSGNAAKDALTHYAVRYAALGMENAKAGAATLRHLFALLLGLGLRESSGRYCEGRDLAAQNDDSETAEAGLFQTSYNLRHASPRLAELFLIYAARTDFADVFKTGVNCKEKDWKNWGQGEGGAFQDLTKKCPAFAVEYAAVGLRNGRKHWGPINNRDAELRKDSDTLFQKAQDYIDAEGIDSI